MSIVVKPVSDSPDCEDFTVTFNSTSSILTTVTSSTSAVSSWISSLSSTGPGPTLVGLDCEWRPNRSPSSDNPAATLQLSVAHRCLIFQLLHSPDPNPPSLAAFLSDPNLTFVGVGISEDVEKLLEDHGIVVKNVLDLRRLAVEKTNEKAMKKKGLAGLAKEVMGVDVKKPKSVQMGRWDQEFLMLDQIGYACVDAFLSFEIGRRLLNGEFSSSTSI